VSFGQLPPQPSTNIVIVGGGTAGWLAALMLQDAGRRAGLALKITVVESSAIPTIGVGEGTTAVFRQMLQHFGLDEFEFLRETEATIKFGIRHQDWRRKGHHYDGPIDDPHLVVAERGAAPQSFLDIYAVAAGKPVTEAHLFGHLLDQHKSPYARRNDGSLVPVGPFHHAFHFDQALAGRYLRKKSKGVDTLDAKVIGVRRHAESGDIEALLTDAGTEVAGDFFIDCTGFRRSLIGTEMGGRWVSYADRLPVNRAMPFWLDLKPSEEIPPYTLARALDAGWLWAIPTQARIGCGYVYSDSFHTPESAQAEIETTLGHAIEPRNDLRFDVGRLDRAWIGNCLALGLASSFLEPLEATSIHGTIVQLMVFTQFHLKTRSTADREAYNHFVARQVDDFRDFINLHYVSEREDTPFWRHVKADCIGAETRARLALWQTKMPEHADFTPLPGGAGSRFPHVEQQLHYPVLDGLGLLTQERAREHMAARPNVRRQASQVHESLSTEYRRAAPQALGHRVFLTSL
jgi:glycine/D-amino acid oxidase-like deaminating enzyme